MSNVNAEIKNLIIETIDDNENKEVGNAIIERVRMSGRIEKMIDDRVENGIETIDIDRKIELALEDMDFGDIVENAIDSSSSTERCIERIAEGVADDKISDIDFGYQIRESLETPEVIERLKNALGVNVSPVSQGDGMINDVNVAELITLEIDRTIQAKALQALEGNIERMVNTVVENRMRDMFEKFMANMFPVKQ